MGTVRIRIGSERVVEKFLRFAVFSQLQADHAPKVQRVEMSRLRREHRIAQFLGIGHLASLLERQRLLHRLRYIDMGAAREEGFEHWPWRAQQLSSPILPNCRGNTLRTKADPRSRAVAGNV